MGSIKYHLRRFWDKAPLIVINVAMFLVLLLSAMVKYIFFVPSLVEWVQLPSTLGGFLLRPWTIITYMFCHYDLWHILFNMLWLYWFAGLFMTLCTRKQLTALYVYGGVGGAVVYLATSVLGSSLHAYSLMPHQGLIGASASVIAIIVATAVLTPDMRIPLLFFGEVKIKWFAIVTLVLFALGLGGGTFGSQMAHIGGALVGALFGIYYRRGIDITRPFNRFLDWAVTAGESKPRFKTGGRRRAHRGARSARGGEAKQDATPGRRDNPVDDIDPILDKIKRSGYAALTKEEKQRLFDASSRLKGK